MARVSNSGGRVADQSAEQEAREVLEVISQSLSAPTSAAPAGGVFANLQLFPPAPDEWQFNADQLAGLMRESSPDREKKMKEIVDAKVQLVFDVVRPRAIPQAQLPGRLVGGRFGATQWQFTFKYRALDRHADEFSAAIMAILAAGAAAKMYEAAVSDALWLLIGYRECDIPEDAASTGERFQKWADYYVKKYQKAAK